MSEDHSVKTQAVGSQPPGRPLGEGNAPEMPSPAGPHSPGTVKPKKAGPEAGGYEQNLPDSSTDNAKGGYGAG
ncbi:hypothetical protein [Methylobacterium sp. Leaf456]|uniref:hypothetical protein n=1 Tax=Methylobacterium sp. Leaf456 TaxID=1736382 RepID=UPI0009EB030A|nr:hypothetical protein [Methylobacterium sp. Leaf456]